MDKYDKYDMSIPSDCAHQDPIILIPLLTISQDTGGDQDRNGKPLPEREKDHCFDA